jgi:hypothetical protein
MQRRARRSTLAAMRTMTSSALVLLGVIFSHFVRAECQLPPDNARNFVRIHKVHHFNGDPPSRGTDTLAIWRPTADAQRFSLCTTGPNYHSCFVEGRLQPTASGEFLFQAGECQLILRQKGAALVLTSSSGWARSGACPRQFSCGMYGAVEPGNFAPKKAANQSMQTDAPKARR